MRKSQLHYQESIDERGLSGLEIALQGYVPLLSECKMIRFKTILGKFADYVNEKIIILNKLQC